MLLQLPHFPPFTPVLPVHPLLPEVLCNFFLKDFIYLFLEEGREGNIKVWLPLELPMLGNLACNPGMCPDR